MASLDVSRATSAGARTLAEKLWDDHCVVRGQGHDPDLLYVDLHLVHEVSSPQAFDGLRSAGLLVRRPDLTLATEDHNTPTAGLDRPIADATSRAQLEALRRNCDEFGLRLHSLGDVEQGIVHIIGPQLGLSMPGTTIACGDSHTSTHGAFGALAIGIGTSEVEHVLATQTLSLTRPRMMSVTVEGDLAPEVTPKDVILGIITRIGVTGAQGHIVEYRGSAIRSLSMEGRMTVCNMSAEAGAWAGLIEPDEITFAYVKGRPHAPSDDAWEAALTYWRTLHTDEDAIFDREVVMDAADFTPFVTWGTNPGQGVGVAGAVPDPSSFAKPFERLAAEQALLYMGLEAGTPMRSIPVDVVFIGSCTNSRIEDLREAADVMLGRHKADNVRVMIVPGSARVRLEAEIEGLGAVFEAFGAEWRHAGCSMCLGMNPDQVGAGQRCASTSNRNFEGRQGPGARTHLVSPAVAAATATRGTLSTPSDLD